MIYRFCLQPSHHDHEWHMKWSGFWYEHKMTGLWSENRPSPQLLRVNKQIYAEALPFLYQTPLNFETMVQFDDFMLTVGRGRVAITKLHIQRVWVEDLEDLEDLDLFFLCVRDATWLQKATIEIKNPYRTTRKVAAMILLAGMDCLRELQRRKGDWTKVLEFRVMSWSDRHKKRKTAKLVKEINKLLR